MVISHFQHLQNSTGRCWIIQQNRVMEKALTGMFAQADKLLSFRFDLRLHGVSFLSGVDLKRKPC